MRKIQKNWSATEIHDLTGKTAIVTGANSGIGYHTALGLGRHGATVIIAARDPERGARALADLRAAAPAATFELAELDLADLSSVRAFAKSIGDRTIDLLVNNAGVMAIPKRETTRDGFERQLGTNHLGHFALTNLLLPALRRSASPRVVTLSSGLAALGKLDPADLNAEHRYSPIRAYGNSKLANLLFMQELARRAPWLTSVASHPGASHSNLQVHANFLERFVMKLIGQSAGDGALPSLYAATGEVASGEYFGPSKLFHMNGSPVEVKQPKRAHDQVMAAKLWEISEQLTGTQLALATAA